MCNEGAMQYIQYIYKYIYFMYLCKYVCEKYIKSISYKITVVLRVNVVTQLTSGKWKTISKNRISIKN